MKARVTTPGDNELGNGGDIKLWTDVPRDPADGSFDTGTTWQLDDTKDDTKDMSGEDWIRSDTDGSSVTVFEPTGTDSTDLAFNDVCRGNCRAVKAMVLSLGGVPPCGNNRDTKRLDGDDFDPDLLTGPARLPGKSLL